MKTQERGLLAQLKPLCYAPWIKTADGEQRDTQKKSLVNAGVLWWNWEHRCTRSELVFDPVMLADVFDPEMTCRVLAGECTALRNS